MDRPKLRKVERFAHRREGEELLVVRDPLGLAEPFAIDADLAPVLDMLDGHKSLTQIRQSLLMGHGLDLPLADLTAFVADLQEAALLDDEVFRDRWGEAHADFLEAPERPPTLAGVLYPEHPGSLAAALERAVPSSVTRTQPDSTVLGVVVPHEPPERAGSMLDRVLRGLPQPDRLEAVVVLGADHGPGLLPFVVTGKDQGTPLGRVPAAAAIVDALERRVGWASREEIRHRDALSIELAVLYLQQVYGEACPPVVPILCGRTMLEPDDDTQVERFIGALDMLLSDREILVWVSGELSHAGQAYGRPALDEAGRSQIKARDREILEALREGKPDALQRHCAAAHPQGRPSGGPPLCAAARLFPVGYRTELLDYELVDAPGDVPGEVALATARIHRPLR